MKIVTLVAMKPDLNWALVERQFNLLGQMAISCPDVDIIIDRKKVEGANLPHTERQKAMCEIRNRMISRYVDFNYHTHVLILDADIVDYPPNLPYLFANHEHAVVGCANFLEDHGARWYDTAGYIYKGQNANLFPPYFPTEECVVDMDSVGMSYLVPVEVFKENKYEPPTGFATEHYSICQAAKRMGYRVLCDLNITIIHAFLPKYGEDCH